ncbi:hypothetical protein MASR2M36_01660 [Providencia sp.]
MINMDVTIKKINQNAIEIQKSFAFGKGECAKYVKLALIHGGASIENSAIRSAKDYGPWLIENGFTPVPGAQAQKEGISYSILGQKKGDVVIIERLKKPNKPESIHGHIALFDGKHWVSDFVQQRGFYPNQEYRDESTPFVLYRYAGNQPADEKKEEKSSAKLIKIVYPIPKNERGQEFSNLDEIMAHVSGESTGNYLLGRNGMWHSGIHITNATTPWCALSGSSITEKASFPIPYKGKQAIRCMADGEIIAYRMNQDYLPLNWKTGSLNLSGSFVLVRHYIQPGETQKSGLHFYTLYMHLAPYSAYQVNPTWIVQDKLPTYAPEWKAVAGTQAYKDQHKLDALPKGSIIAWDKKDSQRQLKAANGRQYGLVTIEKLAGTSKLNVGDQCWTLVDNNNILPEIEPSWWKQLASPAKEMMQFDKVVSLTTPITIKAGESIGHMGFYQAPKEQGIDSRYQVHIECISADDNLPQFLQNPDKVGHDKPQYLKCLPGLMLWNKQGDDFIKTERIVEWEKTFKLSEIKVEKDKNSNEFYLLPEYLGAIPKIALSELNEINKQKAQESTLGTLGKKKNELGAIGHQDQLIKDNIAQYSKFLSQYDLAELGFNALVANANAFDHLNGYVQPQVEFISAVYENIKAEITGSSVPQKGIIAHNYQRLINKIKSDKKETYSPEEYRRAFHNPMFSHIVNKTIVKHPSDWYYKKSDSVWQSFLNILSEEAPLWRSYSEEFLDSMVWMQDVASEKLGPNVWHMHPLVFLSQFLMGRIGWANSKFAHLLAAVESKNDYSAYNQTKPKLKSFYKTNLTKLTISELIKKQKERDIFAAGRYQIIPNTLNDAIKKLKVDTSSLFDEAMQDYIFEEYLIKIKRPSIIKYLEGDGNVEDAIYDWAKEFASAGVRIGKPISRGRKARFEGESYYSGDGLNRAHIMPDEMVKALEESKNGR